VTGRRASRRIRSTLRPARASSSVTAWTAAGSSGRPEHGDVQPARPPARALALAGLGQARQPQRAGHRGDAAGQPVDVGLGQAGRAEQHPEGQVAADDHLLDVQHVHAGLGRGLEERRRHARPVRAGDGEQEGGRPLAAHHASLATAGR
jgi:hypothetical protein